MTPSHLIQDRIRLQSTSTTVPSLRDSVRGRLGGAGIVSVLVPHPLRDLLYPGTRRVARSPSPGVLVQHPLRDLLHPCEGDPPALLDGQWMVGWL